MLSLGESCICLTELVPSLPSHPPIPELGPALPFQRITSSGEMPLHNQAKEKPGVPATSGLQNPVCSLACHAVVCPRRFVSANRQLPGAWEHVEERLPPRSIPPGPGSLLPSARETGWELATKAETPCLQLGQSAGMGHVGWVPEGSMECPAPVFEVRKTEASKRKSQVSRAHGSTGSAPGFLLTPSPSPFRS